jgi:hypothetical protein
MLYKDLQWGNSGNLGVALGLSPCKGQTPFSPYPTHKEHSKKQFTVHMEHTLELSVMSPCLRPVFGPGFTPYPLFQWYPQSKEILLALSRIWDRGSGETHFGRV